MKFWGMTDTGLVRKENQDAYAVQEKAPHLICVVCDGMGGTQGGQTASGLAIEAFCQQMKDTLQGDMTAREVAMAMCAAAEKGNGVIRARAMSDPALEKMGTTLVGAICTEEQAVVCNIGDSRCYHITAEGIHQITRDHSVVENMVAHGEITPAQARRHPNRNLITRALGPDSEVKTDTFTVDWQKGDYLLLCTDGLVNTLSDQEILFEVLYGGSEEDRMERILHVSLDHGAPDNVTVLLVENNGKEAE